MGQFPRHVQRCVGTVEDAVRALHGRRSLHNSSLCRTSWNTPRRGSRPVRLSSVYSPTLPADSTASLDTIDSLKLLLRGGYVRQSASGTYSYLPMGLRVLEKIVRVIEEEMADIGASRVEMPQLLSSALWHKTGRVQTMGSELYRFKDRRDAELILAPTHEEEVTKLIGSDIESHKALPVRVYQVGRKFRDEPRPRAGLLRTKEFLMKDMYSFDMDVTSAKEAYQAVRGAYANIFNRLFDWSFLPQLPHSGPAWREAEADTGSMGGSFSHEFHVEDPIGEDTLLSCDSCSYAANVECAASLASPEQRATSLDQVAVGLYAAADDPACAVAMVYPARATLNPLALARYAGPVWSASTPERVRVVCDSAVEAHDDVLEHAVQRALAEHGAAPVRTTEPSRTMIRTAQVGDHCAECRTGRLEEHRAMEIGHTFLLGARYSEALGYAVVPAGRNQREPLQMGCYGIGVTRILGALAQRAMQTYAQVNPAAAQGKRARAGLVWPTAVAPYVALVLPAIPHTPQKMQAAERLCALLDRGVEPAWRDARADCLTSIRVPAAEIAVDDRPDRSLGSCLFDAELVGYPLVFLLGKHWEKTGEVEVRRIGHATQYATFEGVCPT